MSHTPDVPDDLQEIADALRKDRPALEPLELDAVKLRAMSAAHRSTGRVKRSLVKSHLTALLTVGFLAVGSGGALAVCGSGPITKQPPGGGSASCAVYKCCKTPPPPPPPKCPPKGKGGIK